jgi:hypothetical protein
MAGQNGMPGRSVGARAKGLRENTLDFLRTMGQEKSEEFQRGKGSERLR